MFQVEKRDGTIAEFQMKKITDAIGKAFGAKDMQFSDDMLQMLALRVTADFQSKKFQWRQFRTAWRTC